MGSVATPGDGGRRLSLHADVERRLDVADPDGREMLISCGAALFTLRLAARHLGYEPQVHELPDVDRPNLVADLTLEQPAADTEWNRCLYEQIRDRRTHRGGFRDEPLPAALPSRLREDARSEGAALRLITDERMRAALAALTEAGEQVQRLNPRYDTELARWAARPGSHRADGVPATAYPATVERTEPHYPQRDFARGQRWGTPAAEPRAGSPATVTGTVALLTTTGDDRLDWVRAGQALQRVLLHAGAEVVSAAFHTQALEIPDLREFIASRFCDGSRPQMLLRLGVAESATNGVRRGAEDVVAPEP